MTDFFEKPNLPESEIKKIICGTDDQRILDFFKSKSIEIITITPNQNIDLSVSCHADMAAVHLGGRKIIIDRSQTDLYEKLSQEGMQIFQTEKEISGDYPDDISLNFALFGDFAVGNFKFADKTLLDCIENKRRISVRQGYAKCSMLVVNENAVITDDESIYRKVVTNGIDALLVSKGDILLEGHEYGFIGGASGKISGDTVVFFGDIKDHRSFSDIKLFLEEHGCNFVCSDNSKLRDIGGFISIK